MYETGQDDTGESGATTMDTDDGSSDGTDDDGMPKLDVEPPMTDVGYTGPVIPETCEQAAEAQTTVGCVFYGVDGDNAANSSQYVLAISNVQESQDADVIVEVKENGNWMQVDAQTVAPLTLHEFLLPNRHPALAGIDEGGAYRVTADVPIIVYQFNPIVGSATTDASLLYPTTAWDRVNEVIGWGTKPGVFSPPYAIVVSGFDGTQIDVTSGGYIIGGDGVPSADPGEQFMLALDEGDIAVLQSESTPNGLTGTKIVSDEDHPVMVLSAHLCANIPFDFGTCDHLEEQISGVRQWGEDFIASRVPVREMDDPEAALWQIYASEDGTTIDIEADAAVTGLPNTPAQLDKGEMLSFYASGDTVEPGDFVITADKPIAVMQYMTGAENLSFWPNPDWGDPSMVQLPAVDQFLPRYVVVVPTGWGFDHAVITRPAGVEVRLNGAPIADNEFAPVGDTFEVGRPTIPDGVHLIESDESFGVIIVGYDSADSYAYMGGTGTAVINPNPEG
jgi:hypothetical protein